MAKRKRGACAYCGKNRKLTRDHVIPRALFIELDRAMVTVGACNDCQRIKALGDSDLEVFVTLDIFGSHHPDNLAHAEKIVRRNPQTKAWLSKVLEEAESVPLVTDEGIQIDEALKIEYNFDRIMTMMNMATRGLFYHYNEEQVLPQDCPTHVIRCPWNVGLQLLGSIGKHSSGPPIVKGNVVAWWSQLVIDKKSDFDSLWVVCLNDAIVFVCGTGESEAELEKFDEKLNKIGAANDSVEEVRLPKDLAGRYLRPPRPGGG